MAASVPGKSRHPIVLYLEQAAPGKIPRSKASTADSETTACRPKHSTLVNKLVKLSAIGDPTITTVTTTSAAYTKAEATVKADRALNHLIG